MPPQENTSREPDKQRIQILDIDTAMNRVLEMTGLTRAEMLQRVPQLNSYS